MIAPCRGGPIAIECKWSAGSFDEQGLLAFRRQYPDGDSFVVAVDVERSFVCHYRDVPVRFVALEELVARLAGEPLAAT